MWGRGQQTLPKQPPKNNNPKVLGQLCCWFTLWLSWPEGDAEGFPKCFLPPLIHRGGSYTKPPIMLGNPVLQSFHYEFLQDSGLISVYIVFVLSQVFQ